jgi:protein HIRA/HIR1
VSCCHLRFPTGRSLLSELFRSWDGLTLYAASSDGTIAVLNFDPAELEGIASHSDQEQYLAKFGFNLPPLPEGYSHTPKKEAMNSRVPAQTQQAAANGFDPRTAQNEEEKVNILVAKRAPKDKKRLNLLPTSASSAPVPKPIPSPIPISTSTVNGGPVPKRASLITIHDSKPPHSHSPRPSFSNSFPLPSEQPFVDAPASDSWNKQDVGQLMDLDMPMDLVGVPISTGGGGGGAKGKRKASSIIDLTTEDNSKVTIKARTLGDDRPIEIHVPKEISSWTAGSTAGPPRSTHGSDPFRAVLPTPPLLTYLRTDVEGTDDILESRNIEEDGEFILICMSWFFFVRQADVVIPFL